VVVRVGVIGVNGIGLAHLFALQTIAEADLAAVCDVDAARADKAATDFKVPAFTDATELFASQTVDAVVVATPPGTHGAIVRGALDAGLHVYCEKPIAPTCDEGYALAEHARNAERVLQVGYQFRFHKGYAALRDAVGLIGPVRRVNVVATNWFRAQQYFRASPWRGTWAMAGGGVLMAQAVHQLDALVATVGLPERVNARVRTTLHDAQVEDEAAVELLWAGGARGLLVASLNEPAGYERFDIVGERGAAMLSDGYDVRVCTYEPIAGLVNDLADEFPAEPPEWRTIDVERSPGEWFDMLLDAHRDFAGAVADGRPPLVDAVEGSKSIELANAIYLSGVSGHAVSLPLAPGTYGPVFDELVGGRSLPGS
jgi:predicted dehydrogenase